MLALDLRAELLADRSRLIAATAEPFDSCSACVVSSSRVSESQKNSQLRESLDRPLGNRGASGPFAEDSRGRGPNGMELWLRWSPRIRCCGRVDPDEEGRAEYSRCGDKSAAMSSALPSRDMDNRTLEDGVALFGSPTLPGQEDDRVKMDVLF